MSANKNRRGGLGRGLGALIPTSSEGNPSAPAATDVFFGSPVAVDNKTADKSADSGADRDGDGAADSDVAGGPLPVPGAEFAELPIDQIHPNAKQPRQVFDEDALAELTHSVREFGVLQPIVVRQDADGYELVMGERRLRAATAAGLTVIPAIVRSTDDDDRAGVARLDRDRSGGRGSCRGRAGQLCCGAGR